MTALTDIAEFRRLARDNRAPSGPIAAQTARALGPLDGRVVRFVFSDGTIDRVGDTIDPQGWELADYRRNPVVLWAHDSLAPPIGRTINLFVDGLDRLIGDVQFAKRDDYEFADTIFRLVRGGYIKAGSVGFLPIDYSLSKDRDRDFGIDFKRVSLLEFSLCPVPANANALIEGEAKGIISRREAELVRAAAAVKVSPAERAARQARIAALGITRRPLASGKSFDAAVNALAGTLADREQLAVVLDPELLRRERRREISAIRFDSPTRQSEIIAAWQRFLDRDARLAS